MPEPPTPPPPGDRSAVDLRTLQRTATRLAPVSAALREASARLQHATPDPGEPPVLGDVVDLQAAATDALLALSRGVHTTGGQLGVAVRRCLDAEREVERALRRTGQDDA